MGTRGFIGFLADEKETITYNHFDSYPSGVGTTVLHFVDQLAKDGETLEKYRVKARDIRQVSDDVPPTRDDVVEFAKFADLGVSQRNLYKEWYGLLRETQGQPRLILDVGAAEHAPEWPKDSLFCEWGYLINFDTLTLDVYRGFQTSVPTEGRWAGQSPRPRWEGDDGEYHAVQLVASYDFYDLPDDDAFVAALETDEEDE